MTHTINPPSGVRGYSKAILQQALTPRRVPANPVKPRRRGLASSVLAGAALVPLAALGIGMAVSCLLPALVVGLGRFLPVLLPVLLVAMAALGDGNLSGKPAG